MKLADLAQGLGPREAAICRELTKLHEEVRRGPLDTLAAHYASDAEIRGEFVVVEQRPRAQSRATTSSIPQGHGLVFTTKERPIATARGWAAASMRHGISTVHAGRRHAL